MTLNRLFGIAVLAISLAGPSLAQSSIAATNVNVRRARSGSYDVTLRLAGVGRDTKITQILARTLSGGGNVSLISPTSAAAAAVAGTELRFTAPATVKRFAVTVNGTSVDANGTPVRFSYSRAIMTSAANGGLQ